MEMSDNVISNGSGSAIGYTVEVRLVNHLPKSIGGMTLGQEWQSIPTHPDCEGRGVPTPWNRHLTAHGLLEYEAAQAFRYLFLAGVVNDAWFLETRLVQHKVEWTEKTTRMGTALLEDREGNRKAYSEGSAEPDAEWKRK